MVLFMTRSARDLASLEKFYFFICFGIPFVLAFVPVFISTSDRGLVYGQDVLWFAFTPSIQLIFLFLGVGLVMDGIIYG